MNEVRWKRRKEKCKTKKLICKLERESYKTLQTSLKSSFWKFQFDIFLRRLKCIHDGIFFNIQNLSREKMKDKIYVDSNQNFVIAELQRSRIFNCQISGIKKFKKPLSVSICIYYRQLITWFICWGCRAEGITAPGPIFLKAPNSFNFTELSA